MANFNRFPGAVAVVTGAASGIGRAAAERLADEGAIVYATDLSLEAVTEAHAGRDNLHPAALDVSDSSAVDRVFERVAAEQGHVDAVVNSAGISDSPRRIEAGLSNDLENITDEDFRMVIDINLTGTFFVTRAAVPLLKKTGHGGAIVNISSVGALANFPLEAAYPAAKAGVLGLTRATAALLAPDNIRVNAVAPGATETAMLPADPELRKSVVGLAPLGRPATAAEMAATIVYLLSDEGSFLTGQTISPNGGYVMR